MRWRGVTFVLAFGAAALCTLRAPQPAAARVVVARNWVCQQQCAEKYRTCVPLCRRPTPAENSSCMTACLTAMQTCRTLCRP